MSNENLGGSAAESETDSVGQDQTSNTNSDQVKDPESVLKHNRKLVAELRALKEERERLASQMSEIEQEKLASAGKKDELIQSLKTQVKEREEKLKKTTQSFAMKAVNQQVADAARAMGCDRPELIMKLADLSDVPVGDDFQVDAEALRMSLEKVREDVPQLFKKPVSAPRDGTPGSSQMFTGQKPIGKMSVAELAEMYTKKALEG